MEKKSSKKTSTHKSKITPDNITHESKKQNTSDFASIVENDSTSNHSIPSTPKYVREDLKCIPEDCIKCHNLNCEFYQGIPKKEYVRADLGCRPEDCNDCHNVCCPVYLGYYNYFDE